MCPAAERDELAGWLTPGPAGAVRSDARRGSPPRPGRAWRTLRAAGAADADLLVAGLLHDCGKGPRVRLVHRVAWSLGQRYGDWIWRRPPPADISDTAWSGCATTPSARRELAAAAGCSARTVELIRLPGEPDRRSRPAPARRRRGQLMTSPQIDGERPNRRGCRGPSRRPGPARRGRPRSDFDEGRVESVTHVRMTDFDGPLALLLALIEARQLDVLTVPLGAPGRGVPGRAGDARGRPARQRVGVRGRRRAADPDQEPGHPAAAAEGGGHSARRRAGSRGGAAGAADRIPPLPRRRRGAGRAAGVAATLPPRRRGGRRSGQGRRQPARAAAAAAVGAAASAWSGWRKVVPQSPCCRPRSWPGRSPWPSGRPSSAPRCARRMRRPAGAARRRPRPRRRGRSRSWRCWSCPSAARSPSSRRSRGGPSLPAA